MFLCVKSCRFGVVICFDIGVVFWKDKDRMGSFFVWHFFLFFVFFSFFFWPCLLLLSGCWCARVVCVVLCYVVAGVVERFCVLSVLCDGRARVCGAA